jgi:diguanylate cyclase (GGDEF)-like protein/PAS domain S-box-containing protein
LAAVLDDRPPPTTPRPVQGGKPKHRHGSGKFAAAAVLLVLAVAGSAVLIASADRDRRGALTARIDARRDAAVSFIAAYVHAAFTHEQQVARAELSGSASSADLVRIGADNGYTAAVVLDPTGRVLASQPAAPQLVGQAIAPRYAHLRRALAGIPTASNVVPSAVLGQPIVAFAVPFTTPTGQRVFSAGYQVSDTPLAPFIHNAMSFSTSRAILVDAAGVVIASSDPHALPGTRLAEHQDLAAAAARSGYHRIAGHRSYVSTGAVTGTGWRLTFTVDTSELFAPLTGAGEIVPWAILGGFAAASLLVLTLWRRAQGERRLAADSERLRASILNTASDAFIGMDQDGRITDWNTAAEALLGRPFTDTVGRPLHELIIPEGRRHEHLRGVDEFLRTGRTALPSGPVQLRALHADGHQVPVELSLSRMAWAGGWRFHGFLRDITERLDSEARMRELAMSDPLTGLANRRVAVDRLSHALARVARSELSVAVLFIDVDHFKTINDVYGHGGGDTLLVEVATRLRHAFRTEDTVARLGGDEFAVICEDVTTDAQLGMLAQRIHTTLAKPYLIGDAIIACSCSVGTATGLGTEAPETVLARADAAMYDAKARRLAQPTA